MGTEKDDLIELQEREQQREREENAERGYIPPIRPFELDQDD